MRLKFKKAFNQKKKKVPKGYQLIFKFNDNNHTYKSINIKLQFSRIKAKASIVFFFFLNIF